MESQPKRRRISEHALNVRENAIFSKYGVPPAEQQKAYTEARISGDHDRAFLLLDRWRFNHLPRNEQIQELETLRQNIADNISKGRQAPHANPADFEDLIKPEQTESNPIA